MNIPAKRGTIGNVLADLSGADALWIALAGGAIGSALTFIARSFAVPAEMAANDRDVLERDEDLASWLTDEHVRLKRELHRLREELNKAKLFYSGEYGWQLNVAKEKAIHAYRDQERQARRDVARIHAREDWRHGIWRQVTTQPQAQLEVPRPAMELLDAWATPPTKHLRGSGDPPVLDDPRTRTLDTALAEIRAGLSDFQ